MNNQPKTMPAAAAAMTTNVSTSHHSISKPSRSLKRPAAKLTTVNGAAAGVGNVTQSLKRTQISRKRKENPCELDSEELLQVQPPSKKRNPFSCQGKSDACDTDGKSKNKDSIFRV
mmetsp:Transcript_54456/g.87048  ORF Transcript_54456/g.87048 Transcript_54456/m.87048 type:complete len:116 (+) Transcript_54456:79-426(+)